VVTGHFGKGYIEVNVFIRQFLHKCNSIPMKEKVIFNWSGGKDSALALYKMLRSEEFDIAWLLTSISSLYQRVSMHGVRVALLEAQAEQIGIPLVKMETPEMPTMENYEREMKQMLRVLKNQGATAAAYGDIFLEDLRKYREEMLAEINLKSLFPIWKNSSRDLLEEFLDLGFKTIVVCVNEKVLDKSFAGRVIDSQFLKDLPRNVDPCGENGEFHTFVYDGPIFSSPIKFHIGEVVRRQYETTTADTGFWYCDLLMD
jgi:uncharacterized protein (TIGR00290 family)